MSRIVLRYTLPLWFSIRYAGNMLTVKIQCLLSCPLTRIGPWPIWRSLASAIFLPRRRIVCRTTTNPKFRHPLGFSSWTTRTPSRDQCSRGRLKIADTVLNLHEDHEWIMDEHTVGKCNAQQAVLEERGDEISPVIVGQVGVMMLCGQMRGQGR